MRTVYVIVIQQTIIPAMDGKHLCSRSVSLDVHQSNTVQFLPYSII